MACCKKYHLIEIDETALTKTTPSTSSNPVWRSSNDDPFVGTISFTTPSTDSNPRWRSSNDGKGGVHLISLGKFKN